VPDILTVAKGINSGYVPLGAMIIRKQLADWVRSRFFPGGLTYAGHPLACASAVASIRAFREGEGVGNGAEVGGCNRGERRGAAGGGGQPTGRAARSAGSDASGGSSSSRAVRRGRCSCPTTPRVRRPHRLLDSRRRRSSAASIS